MSRTLTSPPAIEPIALDTAKQHLRIDPASTTEDALLTVLIAAARAWAEGETHRVFITQTWQETFDRFPSARPLAPWHENPHQTPRRLTERFDAMTLLVGTAPVQAVNFVKYVAPDGTLTTLAATQYVTDLAALAPRISPAYGVTWPDTREQPNAVTLEYIAGYGDKETDVPAPIRAAMLLTIGDLYQNRERQIVGTITTENQTAAALLAPYRVLEAV